ncbi:MAG: glycosyltransferase family 39 protein, partial [Solirubrobacterales bacterium]
SRAFWAVASLSLLAAGLRFATLGVQSYHHDEIVTAFRVLRSSFGHAMNAVSYSESAPPLYYVVAWLWAQFAGTGEFGLRSLSALAGVATVPVAFLIGRQLRGRRAGIAAAALVAVNPMLLWYSQEARGYALFTLLTAISVLYFIRSLDRGRRSDFIGWGIASALALATHYFAFFPIVVEALWLLRRRGRATAAGLAIIVLSGLALAPLMFHQTSIGHAEWIGEHALGHRLWETAATFMVGEIGEIIARPETPLPALLPFLLVIVALFLILRRGRAEERRRAAVPLILAGATVAIPVILALLVPGEDYVLARNLMPALVPLLVAAGIGVTLQKARVRGAVVGGALFVYSLGFCLLVSLSPALQRPDWGAVAATLGETSAPRAIVTWALGQAPLHHYLSSDSVQAFSREGFPWYVHEVDFISNGPAAPVPARLLGPGFHEVAYGPVGRLYLRRYALPGPDLMRLRLRSVCEADLGFRNNGVLVDGIGPG